MRLTATDKAIAELLARKHDIERAQEYIERSKTGEDGAHGIIADDLADIDRCIELLRSVAPAPKPEKAAKERKPRRKKGESGE